MSERSKSGSYDGLHIFRLGVAVLVVILLGPIGYCDEDQRVARDMAQKGWDLLLEGKEKQAVELFSAAIDLDAECDLAIRNLGTYLLTKGEHEQALNLLDQAIELNPKDGVAHGNRAYALRSLRRLPEAVKAARRRVELDEENWESHECLAAMLLAVNKPKPAMEHLDRAVKLIRSSMLKDEAVSLAVIHNYRGVAFSQLEQLEKAEAAYGLAIELDPAHPMSWVNRGGIRVSLRKYAAGIDDFSKAMKIDPNSASLYFLRSNAYRLMGNQLAADNDRAKGNELKSMMLKSSLDAKFSEELEQLGQEP